MYNFTPLHVRQPDWVYRHRQPLTFYIHLFLLAALVTALLCCALLLVHQLVPWGHSSEDLIAVGIIGGVFSATAMFCRYIRMQYLHQLPQTALIKCAKHWGPGLLVLFGLSGMSSGSHSREPAFLMLNLTLFVWWPLYAAARQLGFERRISNGPSSPAGVSRERLEDDHDFGSY